jgi:DNA topoisomerase-1
MPDTLVIVESPAKAKTIHKFLGNRYSVQATVGHIMDLPPKKLGVDIHDHFRPEYQVIPGKKKIINNLRASAKEARSILLATDPDREGEAIAQHVSSQLDVPEDRVGRVMFNEITKRAVTEAVKKPGVIDRNKVEAQQARRVMDRLVGYMISPVLWKTVAKGLSAGRVQSVALRLICEREEAISKFVSEEYWSITATFQGKRTDPFASKLEKIDGKAIKISSEDAVKGILDDLKPRSFAVEDIQKKVTAQKPSPPFITSTLQQEASRRFKFPAKKTMAIAQSLYEGVELGDQGAAGLITYMRTDSTRIAPEAMEMVRAYISTSYGNEYLPGKPRYFAKVKAAQEAHEAIRPTSMKLDPKSVKRFLTPDQFKVYGIIWNRFVASQMSDAKIETTTIIITSGPYEFRTSGSTVLFLGFRQVYEETKENNKNGDAVAIPERLNVGEPLTLLELDPKQHFTQPPPRFSESMLIKEMEQNGIGRPSTYAQIISTILDRKYVDRSAGKLMPTALGVTVNGILVKEFPDVFSVDFTARMEKELDGIEEGKSSLRVLENFYGPFQESLDYANSRKDEIKRQAMQEIDELCPECGSPLVIRWGRRGRFIACTAFPKCRYTRPLEEGNAAAPVDRKCPECGGDLVVKQGRYGAFLGCSNYPKCRHVEPLDTGVVCPREGCGGRIVERRSKRGKTFYGCTNYPKCDFMSWYPLVAETCVKCGYPALENRNTQRGHFHVCPNCKAKFPVHGDKEDT